MNIRFAVAVSVATGYAGVVAACDAASTPASAGDSTGMDDDGTVPENGSPDADGGVGAAGDAIASGAAGATQRSFVRIAQWSPSAPAVDVCFAPQAASWAAQAPVFAGLLAAAGDASVAGVMVEGGAPSDGGDGAAAGLTFPEVTAYLVLPPGTYSVRFVSAGADCSTRMVDLASLVLGASAYTTVAAVGESTPVGTDQPLNVVAFADDVTAPAAQAAIRFINASPASPALTPVDFGTGSIAGIGGPFSALFTGVAFAQTGRGVLTDAGEPDVNGYLASNPLAGATLSAHPSQNAASDTTIAANDVVVHGGSAATIALVGGVSNGAPGGAKLLLCSDLPAPATTPFAPCSIVSTQ